jgi:hypothetical protein
MAQPPRQCLLHQLTGAGNGDPTSKTRMIPGKVVAFDLCLLFVHRCTIMFMVEH